MARNPHVKLMRMVSGQVRSYINDHPSSVHPMAISTMPNSIAKRVVGELVSKGVTISGRDTSDFLPDDHTRQV